MQIAILFFAAARDAVGQPCESLEIPAGTAAGRALVLLVARHPALGGLQASLRLAVNEDFVASDHVLQDGDRLALLPPVSGG